MIFDKSSYGRKVAELLKRAKGCFDWAKAHRASAEAQHAVADQADANAKTLADVGKALVADAVAVSNQAEFNALRNTPNLLIAGSHEMKTVTAVPPASQLKVIGQT